jgi:hypothetical protein
VGTFVEEGTGVEFGPVFGRVLGGDGEDAGSRVPVLLAKTLVVGRG